METNSFLDATWENRGFAIQEPPIKGWVKRFPNFLKAQSFLLKEHQQIYCSGGAIFLAPGPPVQSVTVEQMNAWALEGAQGDPPAGDAPRHKEAIFVPSIAFGALVRFLDFFGCCSASEFPQGTTQEIMRLLLWVHASCPIGLFAIQTEGVSALFLEAASDEVFDLVFDRVFEFNKAHFPMQLSRRNVIFTWRQSGSFLVCAM